MNELPFYTVGNEELEGKAAVGKTVLCPHCQKRRKVQYGTNPKTGEVSKTLGFVVCGEDTYLVAVNGKAL